MNHCWRQGAVIDLSPLCWQTQQCQACKSYFLSIFNSRRCYKNPLQCMLSFFVHCDVRRRQETQPEWGKKTLMTWKAKRKEKLWRIRTQRSKEVLHLQTNYRRFPANTWGPERVWGPYSISDNIKTLSYNGQWIPPRCKANLLIYSNSSAGPESVNEEFCSHGDRCASLKSA